MGMFAVVSVLLYYRLNCNFSLRYFYLPHLRVLGAKIISSSLWFCWQGLFSSIQAERDTWDIRRGENITRLLI